MKKQIQNLLLMLPNLSEELATAFVSKIAQEAYEAGEEAGSEYEPAIVGESLGKSGQDFYEWFQNQLS